MASFILESCNVLPISTFLFVGRIKVLSIIITLTNKHFNFVFVMCWLGTLKVDDRWRWKWIQSWYFYNILVIYKLWTKLWKTLWKWQKTKLYFFCQVGPLSDYTIKFLQHLKEFFGVMFKLEVLRSEDDESSDEEDKFAIAQKIKMTCVGIGYVNISKRTL